MGVVARFTDYRGSAACDKDACVCHRPNHWSWWWKGSVIALVPSLMPLAITTPGKAAIGLYGLMTNGPDQ